MVFRKVNYEIFSLQFYLIQFKSIYGQFISEPIRFDSCPFCQCYSPQLTFNTMTKCICKTMRKFSFFLFAQILSIRKFISEISVILNGKWLQNWNLSKCTNHKLFSAAVILTGFHSQVRFINRSYRYINIWINHFISLQYYLSSAFNTTSHLGEFQK